MNTKEERLHTCKGPALQVAQPSRSDAVDCSCIVPARTPGLQHRAVASGLLLHRMRRNLLVPHRCGRTSARLHARKRSLPVSCSGGSSRMPRPSSLPKTVWHSQRWSTPTPVTCVPSPGSRSTSASRDLDQVSAADVQPDGATRLRMAIADVDAWVPQRSPLDRHAAANATSVFTGVVSYLHAPGATRPRARVPGRGGGSARPGGRAGGRAGRYRPARRGLPGIGAQPSAARLR